MLVKISDYRPENKNEKFSERECPRKENIPHVPNIDTISGAIITLSLSIFILNPLCEEGARDGIDIWYMGILIF